MKKKAEVAVTLRNTKIPILALTPTLNLTQTLTLALTITSILTQTQNLTQTLVIIKKIKKSTVNEQTSTHSLLSYSPYWHYVT